MIHFVLCMSYFVLFYNNSAKLLQDMPIQLDRWGGNNLKGWVEENSSAAEIM